MINQNFSLSFLLEQTPGEVFKAIQNYQIWWSGYYAEEFEGTIEKLNDEFSFRANDGAHYSKMKLLELVPDKRMVWLVTESELRFIDNKSEWIGTRVIFDISIKDGKTELRFTHVGLTPESECYEACAPAWKLYLENKLVALITNGK